jgi:hypothetical protein
MWVGTDGLYIRYDATQDVHLQGLMHVHPQLCPV